MGTGKAGQEWQGGEKKVLLLTTEGEKTTFQWPIVICHVVFPVIGGMSQLLLLGKFEYGGGAIFKVVLEC